MKTICRRRLAQGLIATAASLALGILLVGCGGSGDATATNSAMNSAADTTPSPTSASNGGMDAFLAEVNRILGMSNDTGDPTATDHVNVTAPEDKEPAPVS